jgi:polysaccharide export outer membrane protein
MLRRLFALCAFLFVLTACTGHWDPQSPHPGGSAAANFGPVDEDYRLAVADKVKVTVVGEADLSGEFAINKNGALTGPHVGQIQAQGMTVSELERAYEAKLRDGEILRNPKVQAEVTSLRPIYVLGEVKRPGQYAFTRGMTVQKAVALAEGYTYLASEGSIEITRGGTKVTLDLVSEIKIMPGDEVRVPSRVF